MGTSRRSSPNATPPTPSRRARSTARTATVKALTLPRARSCQMGGKNSTIPATMPADVAAPPPGEPRGHGQDHDDLDGEPRPDRRRLRKRGERGEQHRRPRGVAEQVGLGPVVQRRRVAEHPLPGLLVAAREVEREVAVGRDVDDRGVGQEERDGGQDDEAAIGKPRPAERLTQAALGRGSARWRDARWRRSPGHADTRSRLGGAAKRIGTFRSSRCAEAPSRLARDAEAPIHRGRVRGRAGRDHGRHRAGQGSDRSRLLHPRPNRSAHRRHRPGAHHRSVLVHLVRPVVGTARVAERSADVPAHRRPRRHGVPDHLWADPGSPARDPAVRGPPPRCPPAAGGDRLCPGRLGLHPVRRPFGRRPSAGC